MKSFPASPTRASSPTSPSPRPLRKFGQSATSPPNRSSLPSPPRRASTPPFPLSVSLPALPKILSSPSPPKMSSSPASPQIRSLPPRPRMRSLPPNPTMTSLSAGPVRRSASSVPTFVAGVPAHSCAGTGGHGSMSPPSTTSTVDVEQGSTSSCAAESLWAKTTDESAAIATRRVKAQNLEPLTMLPLCSLASSLGSVGRALT